MILPTPSPGREKAHACRSQGPRGAPTPSPPTEQREGGGETLREPTRRTLPLPPSGHAPQKEGGVTEGKAQGVRLPKKPRRRAEGSGTQEEGRSLKGVSYGDHHKGASSKMLPTAPQTNPYKCHKSRQPYI